MHKTTDLPAVEDLLDVVVIGAGPAGLQAALTLGRIHRSAVVLDSGTYRNARAAHMHNVATHDGRVPAQWREAARAELAAYDTVSVRDVAATEVVARDGSFVVGTADGEPLRARAVLLATGLRDVLPDVPGLAGLWGTVAFVCPFCHGHELAGRTVVVQGGPSAGHPARLMSGIAGRVVVVTDGHDVAPQVSTELAAAGVEVLEGRVSELEPDGDGAVVLLDSGQRVEAAGFLVRSAFEQSAPFAAQLGLTLLPSGCVEVDAFGRTSLPGVYAAGDLAHTAAFPMPMASVVQAAAAGQVAASGAVMGLMVREEAA
jgi:thioredoxin reductase